MGGDWRGERLFRETGSLDIAQERPSEDADRPVRGRGDLAPIGPADTALHARVRSAIAGPALCAPGVTELRMHQRRLRCSAGNATAAARRHLSALFGSWNSGDRRMMLVDSHCHLDHEGFEGELETILDRARRSGIAMILT